MVRDRGEKIGERNGLPIYKRIDRKTPLGSRPGDGRRLPPDSTRGCSVKGCGGKHYCKGMCSLHYGRMRLTGQLDTRELPLESDRFWRKVNKTEECWLWFGAVSKSGYGNFRLSNGKYEKPYRYSYVSLVGPIAPGLHIDHLCKTPSCVRPDHLEPVTPAENQRRRRTALCRKGHAKEERYGRYACWVCHAAVVVKRHRDTGGGIPPKMRTLIKKRSGGYCDHCGLPIDGSGHMHHRKLRSQGGRHTAANLLHLRDDCHRAIHAKPELAYENGWLVHRADDPATVSFLSGLAPFTHRFLLDDDGSKTVYEEEAA